MNEIFHMMLLFFNQQNFIKKLGICTRGAETGVPEGKIKFHIMLTCDRRLSVLSTSISIFSPRSRTYNKFNEKYI